MHLAIRADGGPEIGYGHLIRSKSLVEEMQTRDFETTVATTKPESALSVFSNGVEIIELSSRGASEAFVEWLDSNRPDVVFTDAYPVDTEYQRSIRNRAPLAVLQDDNRHAVCADLFVNGNIYAESMEYEFIGEEPTICLGTDYVLLRREIRNQAKDGPPRREQPSRALITMGGSDTSNLTAKVVRAFDGVDIHVDAIVGPGFSDSQEQSIRATAKEISAKIEIAIDPDDLAERMFDADFAVCTSSSTIYELLALGTPIVTCAVSDNQELIARTLRNEGLATVVEPDSGMEGFRAGIERYLTKPDLRFDRQKRGRELVDGYGARRVCSEVLSLVDENGSA